MATFFIYSEIKRNKEIEIIFFDVGFGNSILVKTPNKSILIDAGPPGPREFIAASSAISPTFTKYKIKKLDYLILTSLKPQCIGGATYIISHFKPLNILLPKNFIDYSSFTFYDFLEKNNLWYVTNPYSYDITSLFIENYKFSKFIKQKNIKIQTLNSAEKILEENIDGDIFKLEVLIPQQVIKNSKDEFGNNSLCLKISFGKNSLLLAPQIGYELQKVLVEEFRDKLNSQIILVPQNGHIYAFNEIFVKEADAKVAVCQYGWTNQRIGYFSTTYLTPTQQKYLDLGIKFLRTDLVGAVIFKLNKNSFSFATCVAQEEYATIMD